MTTTSTTDRDNISTRLADGFYQTSTGTKAEGWPDDTNDWMHLISQTHANESNYFALQLSGRFFDNDHFYIRKTNGYGLQPWRELYHSGNLFRNLLEFIPATLHDQIKAGTYTGDLSSNLQAALNTGADVYVPPGRYPLKNGVSQSVESQRVFGATHGKSIFDVSPAGFNWSTPHIFRMNHYGELRDITFDCYQPLSKPSDAGTVVDSGINQYPWLIHIGAASRVRIDNVQMAKGWNGIFANAVDGANPGGSNLSRIEDGCLNCGMWLNGALDFFTIESWESWVYGFAGSPLMNWSYGKPGYVHLQRVDGLAVTSMNMWKKKLLTQLGDTELVGTISNLKLDGGDAHLQHVDGDLAIGTINCLTDSDRDAAVNVFGGRLTIGVANLKQAGALPANAAIPGLLEVWNEARVQVGSGTFISTVEGPEVRVHGGSLQMSNVYFDGRARNKPEGQIIVDAGRLFLTNSHFQDALPGTSGYAVKLNNQEHHQVNHNFMGGRRIKRPNTPFGSWFGNSAVAGEDVF